MGMEYWASEIVTPALFNRFLLRQILDIQHYASKNFLFFSTAKWSRSLRGFAGQKRPPNLSNKSDVCSICSSSISPTMPEFQTFKLTGCGTGRLHWHIPRKARQLEARFQESSGPFQLCVEHYQSGLTGLLQVMDKTNGRNVPHDFIAGLFVTFISQWQ